MSGLITRLDALAARVLWPARVVTGVVVGLGIGFLLGLIHERGI